MNNTYNFFNFKENGDLPDLDVNNLYAGKATMGTADVNHLYGTNVEIKNLDKINGFSTTNYLEIPIITSITWSVNNGSVENMTIKGRTLIFRYGILTSVGEERTDDGTGGNIDIDIG